MFVIFLFVMPASPAQAQSEGAERQERSCESLEAARIPDSIRVSAELRRCVEKMLKTSETFRAQCRRLAFASQLHVDVDVGVVGPMLRAQTTIRRFSSGALFASVTISPLGDLTEWIAHEFEHLLEQIDGVRLADLATRQRGVWVSGAGMFETDRAIRAGRQVAVEMRKGGRTPTLRAEAAGCALDAPVASQNVALR